MLQKMRAGAQTMGAKVFAGIICFVLVVFGFGAFNLFTVSPPVAATVNGEEITEGQLAESVANQRRSLQRQFGDSITAETLDRLVTEESVLQQLVDRALVKQKADDLGMVTSQRQFMEQVTTNPVFQVDGKFDEERYLQMVASRGYSASSYEAVAKDDQIVAQLIRLQENTVFSTDRELRDASSLVHQSRNIAYATFEMSTYREGLEPLEADILEYYELNSADYMSDEEFEISYVLLDRSQFEEGLSVTEDELLELYESNNLLAEADADRRASHILINAADEDEIADARAQLLEIKQDVLDGADFAAIAEEISDDASSAAKGGDLGYGGRGVYVAEFEEALFNLEVGEISDPVETQFGVHLIQLHEILELIHEPFEDVRSDLVIQRIAELADEPYQAAKARMDKIAFENADTLEPLAEELGLEIVTQSGVTTRTGQIPLDRFDVRRALLSTDVIDNGFNSTPIDVSESQAIVGRMISRTAPTLLPLEEVRARVTAEVTRRDATLMAEADRDAAYDKVLETGDYSSVATEFGFEWTTKDGVLRTDEEVPSTLLRAAFEVRLPENGERQVIKAQPNTRDQSIVIVSAIDPGDYDALPQSAQAEFETQFEPDILRREQFSFLSSLRKEASVDVSLPQL